MQADRLALAEGYYERLVRSGMQGNQHLQLNLADLAMTQDGLRLSINAVSCLAPFICWRSTFHQGRRLFCDGETPRDLGVFRR